MRQLTAENYELIEKYLWLVPVVYRKLPQADELVPYKEELLSEGQLGLCYASLTYSSEMKSDPFSYVYKAIKTRMLSFIARFIYDSEYVDSLDETVDDTEGALLIDLIESHYNEPFISSYIDDILDEYIMQVRKDKTLSTQSKNNQTSERYLTRLHDILYLLDKGYTLQEIGDGMGVSKQVISVIIQRLKLQLNKSCYRIVD